MGRKGQGVSEVIKTSTFDAECFSVFIHVVYTNILYIALLFRIYSISIWEEDGKIRCIQIVFLGALAIG